MLQSAAFIANIGVDTAENELRKDAEKRTLQMSPLGGRVREEHSYSDRKNFEVTNLSYYLTVNPTSNVDKCVLQ